MTSKEIRQRFEELNKDDKILCTDRELEEFLLAGLLFKTGKSYVTRNQKKIKVQVLGTKTYNMSIDLRNLISVCEEKCASNNIKRIYCMSQSCYNNYKEKGLIITKGDSEYYRLFESELWLVYKFN